MHLISYIMFWTLVRVLIITIIIIASDIFSISRIVILVGIFKRTSHWAFFGTLWRRLRGQVRGQGRASEGLNLPEFEVGI